ncbi:hypothetical protein [Streptomyces virginiae]|uniref:hypothetical protein n=1 Tax=Streptomyces virginiae TaxID=1961 RepID=UPI0036394838
MRTRRRCRSRVPHGAAPPCGCLPGAPRYELPALSLDWFAVVPFVLRRPAPVPAAAFVAAPYLWHVAYHPTAAPDANTLWPAARSAAVLAWAAHRVDRRAKDLCG